MLTGLKALTNEKHRTMKTISTIVDYKGCPVKIENSKIFLRSFGTTIYNHSMHWTWHEVDVSVLKDELRQLLKENNLI